MIESTTECLTRFLTFTTADWINSISAISALLTAIVTLITVREIKKQREHSYHPDVNIANFDFFVYRYDKDVDEDDVFSLYYSKEKLLDSDLKKGYNELTIDINNIGLAAAKQVSWQWFIDFEKIKKVLENSKIPFIKVDILEDNISVNAEKINVSWFYLEGEENVGDFFNFILPYSIENRKNTIRIPNSFLDLYWLYKAKEILIDNHSSSMEFPPLQLYLKYTNMHGKEIEKTFLIYMAWNFMSNPMNYQSELAKFRFEIVEAEK